MADSSTVSLRIRLVDEATGAVKSVTAQVEGMAQALGEATAKTRQMGDAAKDTVGEMLKWSTVADSLQGLADTLSAAIAPSQQFEDAMRKANTMAGLSEEQFQQMKGEIRAMSREIPLSAAALSDGLYAVVSNGFAASDQLEVLRASARSAMGGCADLTKVIGVTATMIKNYGLQGDAAAAIQDKIQLTAQNGVTSFEELAAALPSVTANAATLGVSIDELLASYATLTGVSGNTAAVSTQLAAILTALSKPSSEASKLAAEMGVQFDAAAIKAAGGMQNFLSSLSADIDSYAARSGMLRETIVATLFGSAEAVKAFTPITGELAAKFDENVQAMQGSAGTMDAAFEQMSQTSGAQSQMLSNYLGAVTDFIQEKFGGVVFATQSVLSAFGTVSSAMPAFQMLSAWIARTGVVTKVWAATTAFSRGVLTTVTTRLSAFRAALMRTAVAQRAVTIATNAWAVAQKVLNFIMSLNPIGLIIAAIGLLVAAVFGVIEAFKRWGDEALLIFGPIGAVILAFKTHWDSIRQAFADGGIVAGLKRIGQVLLDVLLRPVQKLLGWVGELTGWEWAKKAANWVQDVRVDNNLAEPEAKPDPATGKKVDPATGKPATAAGAAPKPAPAAGGIGVAGAAGSVAAKASAGGGQIKRIDIRIDKVVESFTVHTSNLQQSAADIRDMVARALVDAVNDVNYAL